MKLGLYNMVATLPPEDPEELASYVPGLVKGYTREISIVPASSPSLRCNSEGTITDASFALDEPVTQDELLAAEGIDVMTNDNMVMNTITAQIYERIEIFPIDESNTRWSLRFTNEPIPVPPPPPPEPSYEEQLFEAKEMKRQEISMSRDNAIQNGIWVETAFGTEHFSLNEKDQILLLGISSMVMQGVKAYPYHSVSTAATGTNICTIYSDEDIGKIAMHTFAHVTYHESYSNMLQQWLNREEDLDAVRSQIFYGATLPEDLMSYLAMILESSGIDPYLIPGYIPPVLPWEPGVFTTAPQASAHVTYASDEHCEIMVQGINVLPCIMRPEVFPDIENPECIELAVDLPMQRGEKIIVSEANPLLGKYYSHLENVYQRETGEWVKETMIEFPADNEEPFLLYPLLVGGKMNPEDEPFGEIHLDFFRYEVEDDEAVKIKVGSAYMTYTISSSVEFGDGTDIPDPDMPVWPAPPPPPIDPEPEGGEEPEGSSEPEGDETAPSTSNEGGDEGEEKPAEPTPPETTPSGEDESEGEPKSEPETE